MEVETEEIDILALLKNLDQLVKLVLLNSELVLVESGSHVFVRMCIDIRIDPD